MTTEPDTAKRLRAAFATIAEKGERSLAAAIIELEDGSMWEWDAEKLCPRRVLPLDKRKPRS